MHLPIHQSTNQSIQPSIIIFTLTKHAAGAGPPTTSMALTVPASSNTASRKAFFSSVTCAWFGVYGNNAAASATTFACNYYYKPLKLHAMQEKNVKSTLRSKITHSTGNEQHKPTR